MVSILSRVASFALLALAAPFALADVYTWKDASGRLNVSNVAPPDGVHVESVVHEDPPKVSPSAAAARAAEVQTLNERVAQLEDEVTRAKQQAALPPVVYHPMSPPPVQVTVNVMPSQPAADYAPPYPGYAGYPGYPPYPVYSGYPYPGYPGLPYDYCDPTIFGCPTFGYPVGGVVVLNSPQSFGAKHGRMRGPGGLRPMPVRGGFGRR